MEFVFLLLYLGLLVVCFSMCISFTVSYYRQERREREASLQSREQELTENANTSQSREQEITDYTNTLRSVGEQASTFDEKENELRMEKIKYCLFTSTIQTTDEAKSIQSIIKKQDTISCSDKATSGDGDGDLATAGDDSSPDDSKPSSLFMNTRSRRTKVSSRLPFVSHEIKDICSICLQGYEIGEKVAWPMSDECEHLFHEKCISIWLKKEEECPLCRCNILKYRNTDEEFAA